MSHSPSGPTTSLSAIELLLQDARYETARRLCLRELETAASTENRNALWLQLHTAYRLLGDYPAAMTALEQIIPTTDAQTAELLLRRAEDAYDLSNHSFYRGSAEARQGWTAEQYADKWEKEALLWLEKALLHDLGDKEERVSKLSEHLKITLPLTPPSPPDVRETQQQEPDETRSGKVEGALRFPDGTPVSGARITLGLAMTVVQDDPVTYHLPQMHSIPRIGPQQALYAVTGEDGSFSLPNVPAGKQEFLAVTLVENRFEIPTRFLVHGPVVPQDATVHFDLTVDEWHSAPPRDIPNPFPALLQRHGQRYRLLHTETHKNPFHFEFPRQLVHFPVPQGASRELLLLVSDEDTPQPWQIADGELYFFASLAPITDRVWALYEPESGAAETFAPPPPLILNAGERSAVISTGRAHFCIPWGENFQDAPLRKVQGEDGPWRGQGRWTLPGGVTITAARAQVQEWGPILGRVRLDYRFSDSSTYSIQWTFHAGEAYALAHEVSPRMEGAAWEFSLREWSGNGRGFLHWAPETGTAHWTSLAAEDRELARLQESVPWWIPPAGFGYAMTADGLSSRDYLALFTTRRGDWVDRDFEKLTRGPVDQDGTENRELDWPFPEMVGSTISMLTAHTGATGDAYFRWKLFEGERHWGFLASTLERNDGTWKELSAVQHKNSSPRLQDFKSWHLDEPDAAPRPHLVARREDLVGLRARRTSPAFSEAWNKLLRPGTRGAVQGMIFAVANDPLVAWRKKRELVAIAPIRSKMTLLGRDYSDMYSPVGGRPITHWAEEYDLIAASGVFTPEEEREVRAFLMLMGHLYMSTDLMNWKNGSRNANFEADRVDVVSTVGLCFPDNPDSAEFIQHAISGMERAMEVYCTPGSGKWYENPACYYLQASKCRANLVFHLWRAGLYDVSRLPRFREFLNWGLLLLTPPTPPDYTIMRDGCSHEEFRAMNKVRRLPPIGDHARLGPWVPEHYALMSLIYREQDPDFAARLLWAYRSGGSDGSYFGNVPLYFAAMNEQDLAFQTPARHEDSLQSRRLEGFGAVMRGNVGAADEFYLLVKQGPGGYRYHRTEGSFILFADGKPLVYDGGEAGETWRHSTLSFYDAQMPLAPGHVEHFHSSGALDWVSGVHPTVIHPDQPIFLSDQCNHELVPESWRRFREPNPAAARSVVWVKDEYVVIHDELHLPPDVPSQWHLQVVANEESGTAETGFTFRGRFGTDLQVLLPDQKFSVATVEALPMLEYDRPPSESFTQRHLHVSSTSAGTSGYLAILRPLATGKTPLQARALWQDGAIIGAHVQGEGINDWLFFHRTGLTWREGTDFSGSYGAILNRPDGRQFITVS